MVGAVFIVYSYGDDRELHVLTHAFPTRRSSDLLELRRDDQRVLRARPLVERLIEQPFAQPRGRHRHVGHVDRSEENTSELVTNAHLVCRILLEKKKWT